MACSKDAIVMVEGGAAEALEADVIDALMFAHKAAQPILSPSIGGNARRGRQAQAHAFQKKTLAPERLLCASRTCATREIFESSLIKDKKARYDGYKATKTKLATTLAQELGAAKFAEVEKLVKEEFEDRKYHVVREYVLGAAQAHRRAGHEDRSRHRLRGGDPAARSRVGALPARRNTGGRGEHAGHVERRAEDRCADRRTLEALHGSITTSRHIRPARRSPYAVRGRRARSVTERSPSAPSPCE